MTGSNILKICVIAHSINCPFILKDCTAQGPRSSTLKIYVTAHNVKSSFTLLLKLVHISIMFNYGVQTITD